MKVLPLFMFACSLASCSRSDIFLDLNQGIQHDDFVYSVTKVEKSAAISADSLTIKPSGQYYLVEFQVENQALRVNHPWKNSVAYIIDEQGTSYENLESAQQVLNKVRPFGWLENYLTPAGETQSVWLVFDLPVDVKDPCLMVRGETLMGDFLNGGKFRHSKIRLGT